MECAIFGGLKLRFGLYVSVSCFGTGGFDAYHYQLFVFPHKVEAMVDSLHEHIFIEYQLVGLRDNYIGICIQVAHMTCSVGYTGCSATIGGLVQYLLRRYFGELLLYKVGVVAIGGYYYILPRNNAAVSVECLLQKCSACS